MLITIHKMTTRPTYGVFVGAKPWGPEGGLAGNAVEGSLLARFRTRPEAVRHALALEQIRGWKYLAQAPVKTGKPKRSPSKFSDGNKTEFREDLHRGLTANVRVEQFVPIDDGEWTAERDRDDRAYNPLARLFY